MFSLKQKDARRHCRPVRSAHQAADSLCSTGKPWQRIVKIWIKSASSAYAASANSSFLDKSDRRSGDEVFGRRAGLEDARRRGQQVGNADPQRWLCWLQMACCHRRRRVAGAMPQLIQHQTSLRAVPVKPCGNAAMRMRVLSGCAGLCDGGKCRCVQHLVHAPQGWCNHQSQGQPPP